MLCSLSLMIAIGTRPGLAVPVGWFDRGAERATLGPTGDSDQVEVPLLRGHGDPRPRVEARVDEGDPVAAVVDLGHGWMRIGSTLAARWGLPVRSSTWRGQTVRHTRADWLRVGDLVLVDVRLEVVSGEELFLAAGVLDEVVVAVLPSEGVVRFASGEQGRALLEDVSPPVVVPPTPDMWWEAGERHSHHGPWLGLPVEALVGDERISGIARIRTDRAVSTMAPGVGVEQIRGGSPQVLSAWSTPTADVGLGWHRVHEGADPSPELLGQLAADQLATVDVAVSAAQGLLSMREVEEPRWTPLESVEVDWVEARAESWRVPQPNPEPQSHPEGDPGDLLGRSRWTELASARWRAGHLEAALRADGHLALVAGDHCEPWLEHGKRLLAMGRAVEAEEALERSAELFEAWARQTPQARAGGRSADPDRFSIPQPTVCEQSLGWWMRSRLAMGDVDGAEVLLDRDLRLDPGPQLALAAALAGREALRPEGLLRTAWSRGRQPGAVRPWLMTLQPATSAFGSASQLPGSDDPHPLATAFAVVHLVRSASPEDGGEALLADLARVDPLWLELRLAAATSGLHLPGPALDTLVASARARRPGDPALACLAGLAGAVDVALPPDSAGAPHPDCLVARMVAASRNGAWGTRDALEAQLRSRWPTVPVPPDDP